MVLEDEALSTLVESNLPLLKAGALVLDLRSTVKSFEELVLVKYGKNASYKTRALAERLDNNSPSVIHFDPDGSSNQYKWQIKSFLESLIQSCSSGDEEKAVLALIRQIDDMSGYLRYEEASNLKTGFKTIDVRINAAAKFLYCTCGSSFVSGIAQVPHELWATVHADSIVEYLNTDGATDVSNLSYAHAAVLEHFAVDARAFDRLHPKDIVDLRQDGATRQAIEQLNGVVDDVDRQFNDSGTVNRNSIEQIIHYRRAIDENVKNLCLKQSKRRGLDQLGGMSFEEGVSLGTNLVDLALPGIGILRKGILSVGRALSRKSPKLAKADLTMAPIPTYISRLQGRISIRG